MKQKVIISQIVYLMSCCTETCLFSLVKLKVLKTFSSCKFFAIYLKSVKKKYRTQTLIFFRLLSLAFWGDGLVRMGGLFPCFLVCVFDLKSEWVRVSHYHYFCIGNSSLLAGTGSGAREQHSAHQMSPSTFALRPFPVCEEVYSCPVLALPCPGALEVGQSHDSSHRNNVLELTSSINHSGGLCRSFCQPVFLTLSGLSVSPCFCLSLRLSICLYCS